MALTRRQHTSCSSSLVALSVKHFVKRIRDCFKPSRLPAPCRSLILYLRTGMEVCKGYDFQKLFVDLHDRDNAEVKRRQLVRECSKQRTCARKSRAGGCPVSRISLPAMILMCWEDRLTLTWLHLCFSLLSVLGLLLRFCFSLLSVLLLFFFGFFHDFLLLPSR